MMTRWILTFWPSLLATLSAFFSRSTTKPTETTPIDRAELFAQLDRLRADRVRAAAAYQNDVARVTRDLIPVQASVDAMRRSLATIHAEAWAANIQAGLDEDTLIAQLRHKSSMSILLFIEELDSDLADLNHAADMTAPMAHRDYERGKKTVGFSTDAPSRRRRATALHAARARAVAMQDELLTIGQLNAEIISLRKSIPAIEQTTIFNERTAILAAV